MSKRETPKFTALYVKSRRPAEERYDLRDGGCRGLVLRVFPGGGKSFRWRNRRAGKFETIGTFPEMSVEQARARVAELRAERRAGRPAPTTTTVQALADSFMVQIRADRKVPEQVEDILRRDVLPVLGERVASQVEPREVADLVKAVAFATGHRKEERPAPTAAGKVLATISQMYRHGMGSGLVEANPAAVLVPRSCGVAANECDRLLTVEEIPAFWKALEGGRMTPTCRDGLRLLLLLGARTGELRQATWDEINFDAVTRDGKEKPEEDRKPTWTIPVAHQKLTKSQERRARPFVVPLPPTAVTILAGLKGAAERVGSRYVLASPVGGEALTDKALIAAMRKLFVGEKAVLKFDNERPTPHDLRRTMRTHLRESLSVDRDVAERCLNHVLPGMERIYDRGDYLAQRMDALARWDAFVSGLVSGKGATVVGINSRRA